MITTWGGQQFRVIGPTPLPPYAVVYNAAKNTWRLEARKRDKRTEDFSAVERVGLDGWPDPMPPSGMHVTDFYYRPESGCQAKAAGDWLLFYETHCLKDPARRGEYEGSGPLGLISEWSAYNKGSRFRVSLRKPVLDAAGNMTAGETTILFDGPDLIEGAEYHFTINERFGPDGLLRVWRNAKLIVDYAGSYGYGDVRLPYRCARIYRGARADKAVVKFRAFSTAVV